MTQNDYVEFLGLWRGMADRYEKLMSDDFIAIDFRALEHLAVEEVRLGVQLHVQHPTDSRFFPKPGQIIGHVTAAISAADGRLGEEEAWALVRTVAEDEFASVVWTQEIAEAWGIARHVMPDKVGARMAFKEAYTRLVTGARSKRLPTTWTLCQGFDREGRVQAVRAAAALGRHVHGADAVLALDAPSAPVALLEGPVRANTECALAAIRRLRDVLAASDARRREAASADADARRRTSELRAASLKDVQAFAAAQGIDLPRSNSLPIEHD